jgi:hypothetical protein
LEDFPDDFLLGKVTSRALILWISTPS